MLRSFNKIFIALILVSCARPLPPVTDTPQEKGTWVDVLFRAGDDTRTKDGAPEPEWESAISRWAVFAFDRQNGWFRYASSQSGSSISLKLLVGHTYDCYAIVNYPLTGMGAFLPETVKTPGDFIEKVAYLGDNRIGSLLMFGTDAVTITDNVIKTKTIHVARLVSRIEISRIKTDFSERPHLAAKTFTLRHIYIINAYRTTRFGSDYTPAELAGARISWYNSGGWHRGEPGESSMDALLGKRDIHTVITADTPYTVPSVFYAFPNSTPRGDPTDPHQMDEWEKRCTRLVIEVTMDDETFYYQINIPSMARNHIYAASEVIIRGRGSSDPEIVDTPDDDPIVITINWQDGWDDDDEIEI